MAYKKYTLYELRVLMKDKGNFMEQTNVLAAKEEMVYQKLFEGLDIYTLRWMCMQVGGILAMEPQSKFKSAMLSYVTQIGALIPAWRKTSEKISAYAAHICNIIDKFSNDFVYEDSDRVLKLVKELKQELDDYVNMDAGETLALENRQKELSVFIEGELSPVISKWDKQIDDGIVQCLCNDKFIDGTETSIYNGSTLFSFVKFMQEQNVEILNEITTSWTPEEIVFIVTGQADIWEIIYSVSKNLVRETEKFSGGRIMYTSQYNSSEEMFKDVERVCAGVELKGKEKCTLAQRMLRLMGGDEKVLTELPVFRLQNKLGDEAENALATETSVTSIKDSKGLLGLTKENVIDIYRYVKIGLRLKMKEDEVEKELNYTKDSEFCKTHPSFSPANFVQFYKPFNDHAKLWDGLEQGIIEQGNNIQVYGTKFVNHAKFVLAQLEKTDIFKAVEDVEITDPNDHKILNALSQILDRWREETSVHSKATTNLLNRLKEFQNTLVNILAPSASDMANKLEELNIVQESKNLQADIKMLNDEISAKEAEYKKDCGLANTGAAGIIGGPLVLVTWAVTGGIYGAKAEKVRKERNELIRQRDEKQKRYNELNSIAAHVAKVTGGIADLNLAVTNAITGLKSLNAVWGLLDQYISEAKVSLDSIDKKSMLMEFCYDLEGAQASWECVPSIAGGLLELFKETKASSDLNDVFEDLLQKENNALYEEMADKAIWDDRYAQLCMVVINPKAEYASILQNKAQELRTDAIAVYNAVTDIKIAVISKSAKLLKISAPEDLDKIAQAIKDNPSDERATAMFNFKIEKLKKEAENLSENIAGFERCIETNTSILYDNVRTDLIKTKFYAQLNNECKRFEQDIQQHTQLMINNFIEPMQSLAEQMEALDSQIKEKIDPEKIISTFKEFLPSEEEISDMITAESESKETKELQTIKMIYSTALKAMDVLAETIVLCSKIEERSQLATKLNELQKEYDKMGKKHEELLGYERELKELLKLPDILGFFANEGIKLLQMFKERQRELAISLEMIPVDYKKYHTNLLLWKNEMEMEALRTGRICIVPLLREMILSPQKAGMNDTPSQQSIKYTQGYGQLSTAGASVQIGVKGHISINMQIESVSEEFYKEVTDRIINSCSKSVQEELKQHNDAKDYKNWWFAFFAGTSNGQHDSNYYKSQQSKTVTSLETDSYNAVHELASKHRQTFQVSGEFEIIGQSYIITTVYLFIETLTVQTSEGMTLIVPTQNTAVADKTGNTGAGTTDSKLNIMPLN